MVLNTWNMKDGDKQNHAKDISLSSAVFETMLLLLSAEECDMQPWTEALRRGREEFEVFRQQAGFDSQLASEVEGPAMPCDC